MLYDPKWEVKADPMSLAGLIAWLEKQDPNTAYDYDDVRGRCLICQYLTSQGIDWLNYCDFSDTDIRNSVAAELPQTFGAALERARAQHSKGL